MTEPARLLLAGGPFDGHYVAGLPPDVAAPVQVVWSGWVGGQFTAWLYEWHGEARRHGSFLDALIYRPTGRVLAADEIPPLIAEQADLWANTLDMLSRIVPLHPSLRVKLDGTL